MTKNLLSICTLLFISTFIIISCQKNKSSGVAPDYPTIYVVPEQVARSVAEKFDPVKFFKITDNASGEKHGYKWTANGHNTILNQFVFKDSSGYPAFYIFNFANNGGFVMVSADYNIQPVLAFVETGEFKKDAVPATLIEWVNRTFENTEVVRKGLYDNSRAAKAGWNEYLKGSNINSRAIEPDPGCQETSTNVTVGPLLPVTWGQGCSYNDLCPSKSCSICYASPAAYTGCVATAASQIVRYWQPTTQYGYSYASMPTATGSYEVQRLMRDLGLPENVNMDYGCDGSSASGGNVPGALKARFGMTSANRIEYGGSTYDRVQSNLGYRWPVLLEGCRTRTNRFLGIIYTYSDCHEWVCDGYSATQYTWCNSDGTGGGAGYLYFHMNWGWHESGSTNDYNGWFAFNNWNISGLNWNYQYSNDAVTEIHP